MLFSQINFVVKFFFVIAIFANIFFYKFFKRKIKF